MATIGIGFDLRRARCRRMRRDLYCLSWIRTILRRLRAGLRPRICRLPGLRYSRGWRPGVLYSWSWLLRGPFILRLEAWTLAMAQRPKSLDPRPLRSEIIEPRAAGFLASLQAFRNSRSLNDRRSQPPACKAETQRRCQAAQSVAYASAEVDR